MSFPTLRSGDQFLGPGELHCGFAPARVWTILGSCVSVVIWHRQRKFGALSHYLLPENPQQRGGRSPGPRAGRRALLDPRYGVDSCELILRALDRAGIAGEHCAARLYGGSQIFASQSEWAGGAIGRRNADVAREFLAREKITLLSESLFGAGHRRILFDLDSGRVWEKIGAGIPGARNPRKLRALP